MPPLPNISCYGDSDTNARERTHQSYPEYLRQLTHRQCFQGGVGGETTEQIRTRLMSSDPAAVVRLNDTMVIWAGHNDFQNSLQFFDYATDEENIKNGIQAMVAALPHERYVVLTMIFGLTTARYWSDIPYREMRARVNDWIRSTYGNRVVDVDRFYKNYDPQDGVAFFEDRSATLIMFDNSHPNSRGTYEVARLVSAKLLELGY